jgi:hypothetical protein
VGLNVVDLFTKKLEHKMYDDMLSSASTHVENWWIEGLAIDTSQIHSYLVHRHQKFVAMNQKNRRRESKATVSENIILEALNLHKAETQNWTGQIRDPD